jgi:hypothetical protein
MTPEELKADKRLRRTYGITLEEYNQKLAEQNGGCAICHRPPSHIRLAVDHDHKFDRIKITVRKTDSHSQGKFLAECRDFSNKLRACYGDTKKEARISLRLILRRMSLRGLLCVNCNRGLQKFYDKPERFEAAARYLKKFEAICKSAISPSHTPSSF